MHLKKVKGAFLIHILSNLTFSLLQYFETLLCLVSRCVLEAAGEAAELVLQSCSRQRCGPEKDVQALRCVCLAGRIQLSLVALQTALSSRWESGG